MATDFLKRDLVSHTRKVCSLYKRMSRDIQAWEWDFYDTRFKKLQLRQRFDEAKNIKDMRVAKKMLLEGEEEHEIAKHPQPIIHPFSKNGIAYGRALESPDWVMDFYHPLEKARYPYYFAKREQLKDEYIKLWNKTYGKTSDHDCLSPEAKEEEAKKLEQGKSQKQQQH